MSRCVGSNRDEPPRCPLREFVSYSRLSCPRTERVFQSDLFVRRGCEQKFPLPRSRRAQRPCRGAAMASRKKSHVPTFVLSASTRKNTRQRNSSAHREPDSHKARNKLP